MSLTAADQSSQRRHAVVLYPIVRRQNELLGARLNVAPRIIESRLHRGRNHPRPRRSSASRQDWLNGPADGGCLRSPRSRTGRSCSVGLIVPFGNGLILGYLMYTSGLVPSGSALSSDWIGGPLLLIGSIGALFDCDGSRTRCPALLGRPRVPVDELFLADLRGGLGRSGRMHRSCRRQTPHPPTSSRSIRALPSSSRSTTT